MLTRRAPRNSRRRRRSNQQKLDSLFRSRGALLFESLEERVLLSITVNDTFDGIDQITSRPPDPIVSVGPEHLIAMVNTHIALYDKDGNQLELADLDAPFGGNSGFFEDVDAEFGSFDPWSVYDRYSDRFFVLAEEIEFGVDDEGDPLRGGFGADEAYLLIGASTSDAPNDLDVAPGDFDIDWWTVSIDATHDFGNGLAWIDYPKFVTDADSVYITGNYFRFGDRAFQGVLVTRLDKADLLGGVANVTAEVVATPMGDDIGEVFTLQPVQSINRSPGEPQLFVDAFNTESSGVIGVWEMDDANALTHVVDISAPYNTYSGGVPQAGTADNLDSLSARLMNAVWRDESIWTAHTVDVGGDATVRWYEIDTTGGAYSITQDGDIDPGDDIHTFMPSIGVDASGNMGITFTQSSNNQSANMMVTGRKPGQPLGFTEPAENVRTGAAGYDPSTDDVERWGDYAGLALDPIDDHTFWAFGETALDNNTWTTSFAQFEVGPLPEDEFDLGGATNNSLATATVLGSLPKITLRDLTIDDSDDVDYFKITAQDTGKLILNVFFQDALGDLDISVVDMNGNTLGSSTSTSDNEQIIIPVVSQEMYFLKVFGFAGDTNVYALEIENFAAPVPSGVHLDPASDTGMMSNDNYTADSTPRFIIQADLSDFADMGINILSPAEVAGGQDGAAVQVFIINSTTGVTTTGYADPIGTSNILFEFTPGFLGDGVYFVSAAVRIFDGQTPQEDARSQLSEPLWMTIDTQAPQPSIPDLLDSSDTGMLNDDDVTNKMSPAFSGQGELNAKVRVLADGVVVGQGVVNTNGLWEVTVEPLADGEYDITTELEDLAGNVSFNDPEEGLEPLTIWIDTAVPNTPLIDLVAGDDTGHSDTDNITNVNMPELILIGNDTIDGNGNPFPNDVKYRLYDRPGNGAGEVLLFDSFASFGTFVTFGQFTFFTPGGLTDGVHNLKLEIEDRAGNISPDFLLSLEIDTVTPVANVPDLLESSDTGMLNDDNVTNKMQPAFTGVSEVNSTVRVFAQNVLTGTINLVGEGVVGSDNSDNVPGDDQGRYEVTVEPLADGTYDIFVTIEDWAGNLDTSEALRIEIDATAPNTPYLDLLDDNGHSATDNITNDNTPEVSMTTEDPNAALHILFTDNLKFRIFDRYEGSEEFLLYDSALDVAVDAVSTAADGFTSLQLILETLPDQYFNLFGANPPAVLGLAGVLADGVHNLKLEVEDRAGNISHDFLLSIEIDTSIPFGFPPDMIASSDTGMFDDDNVTSKMEPAFTGVAEANALVRVFATNVVTGEMQLVGEGLVGSDLSDVTIGGVNGFGGLPDDGLGLWEVTVEPLADAVYDIQVEYEDWGGNVSELSEPLRIEIDTFAPNTAFLDLLESSDSGRHNDDNVTNYNTPTVSMTTEDPNAALHQILFTDNLKFRIFDRFEGDEEFLLYDSVLDVAVDNISTAADGFTSLQQILETLPTQYFALFGANLPAVTAAGVLADGFHDLKLEVEDRAGNISHDFLFDLLIDTVAPPVTIIGIDPSSTDTGVEGFPATFTDRVTSDTGTGFIGRAEADAIVRLYVDPTNNDAIDIPAEFALTVAVPFDGNDAFPNGEWRTSFIRDLNDPAFFPFDQLREVIVEAEDLAGNVNLVNGDAEQMLEIFIDTQGPQVTDVFLTNFSAFDLFDPKPSEGPTPPVFSITIDLQDFPQRDNDDPNFLYEALLQAVAEEPGHYLLRGDANGVIPIANIVVINDPRFDNTVATASVILQFNTPLPDDRYTLTLSDTLVDPVGNALDGETNTIEPQENPVFPSGDQQPGGDFVARFTIDSRPEIGTYAHGNVYLDINGNLTFDPTNVDFVNRDLISQFGALNDDLFAGDFAVAGAASTNGFDKLAAYGQVNGVFRFLIDFNGNMAIDPGETFISSLQINAIPIAGDFNPAHPGDEIGLFDGTTWYLDTNANFMIDAGDLTITGDLRGFPIVGDFDGDGNDDLATYQGDLFRFDLNFDGNVDDTIAFGFPGVLDRPVAADLNLDGIDDIGLFVPNRDGVLPGDQAEWFFLISEQGQFPLGTVDALDHPFSPVPLGNDIFAQFGDDLAVPLIGNFDPPVAAAAPADPAVASGVGLYDAVAGTFLLKNETSAGAADNVFRFGPKDAGWLPVTGDWDGNSTTTVGLFDPVASKFFLTNDNASGVADNTFRFGPSGAGWIPLSGDWDGDGDVTIGLFDPNSGTFFLSNENTAGVADIMFRYGPAGAGWTPLVGDWNNDGTDTIGLFAPDQGVFFLRDSNSAGFADTMFRYGPAGLGWTPMAGDWDGDGDDTVGLYNPVSGSVYLRNENSVGTADVTFPYGPAGSSWIPLAGDWEGNLAATAAASSFDSTGLASFLASSASVEESSEDNTSTALVGAVSAAVASSDSSTSETLEGPGSTDVSSDGAEQGSDEILDLAIMELTSELSSGGIMDPAV